MKYPAVFAWWKHVTLEPTIFIFLTFYEIVSFLETNLLLHKTCYNATFTEPDVIIRCDNEKFGQEYVAEANAWRFYIMLNVSLIFTIFGSVWSQKHDGECRFLIFIPVFGQLLQSSFNALNSYFWIWNPNIVTYVSSAIQALTGSKFCLYYGAQQYIANITKTSNRTQRISIIVCLHYICLPIGSALGGILNTKFGFTKSFLICAVAQIIALCIGWLKMKGPSENSETKIGFFQSINPVAVFKSTTILFKKRKQHKQLILILLLILDPLQLMPQIGEQTVMYLYLRYRFGWQENEYSVYTAYKMMGTLAGTLFCTMYLSKYMKIHDGIIGTLAAFWDTVGNISYFFANKKWELYVIPVYNIFNGVLFAMMASLSTKCVDHNEMGYLTSVRSLMQIVSPLSFPLYGLVYKSTIDTLPNAFFLLSMAFNFPTIILFGISYYLSKDMIFEEDHKSENAVDEPNEKQIKL